MSALFHTRPDSVRPATINSFDLDTLWWIQREAAALREKNATVAHVAKRLGLRMRIARRVCPPTADDIAFSQRQPGLFRVVTRVREDGSAWVVRT